VRCHDLPPGRWATAPDDPSADERTYCRRQGSPALGLTRPAGVPDRTGQSVPGASRTATPSRRAGSGVRRGPAVVAVWKSFTFHDADSVASRAAIGSERVAAFALGRGHLTGRLVGLVWLSCLSSRR
jgi:hypothetical protein